MIFQMEVITIQLITSTVQSSNHMKLTASQFNVHIYTISSKGVISTGGR